MDSCCENKAGELAQLRASQSRVLYIALAINAVMFVVEFSAGWIASSTALLGDSLDMFGDASVYALTLFVLDRSRRARAGAALFKGGFMLLFGLVVVADAIRKLVLVNAQKLLQSGKTHVQMLEPYYKYMTGLFVISAATGKIIAQNRIIKKDQNG